MGLKLFSNPFLLNSFRNGARSQLVLDLRQKEQKRRERKKNKEEDQMAFEDM